MTEAFAGRWRELAADGAVVLDGFHALKHALRFGGRVPLALAADKPAALALARRLAPDLAGRLDALLTPVEPGALREFVPRPHPTGVAALAVPAPRVPAAGGAAPVIVLDNPRHLGNIGAVIRLAAGAGAAGVVTTGTVDPWHPSVLRAAAGLHFATAVGRAGAAALPPGPLYAFDAGGEDIRDLRFPPGALLAFGSERAGLSPQTRSRATSLVALPMRPGVSSYNVATSVAMALYHWMSR
jgi:TrmH family RNA methyltransferase